MGRPKGSKNKPKLPGVNPAAMPKGYDPVNDVDGARCACCGKVYKVRKSNFATSLSPLYNGSNHYIEICRKCLDRLFDDLVSFFNGNEEKAAERLCQKFDWYWAPEIWETCRKISADRSKIGAYPSKMQLPQWTKRGTTYLDTIRLRASDVIGSIGDFEDMKENDQTKTTRAQILRWGPGFSESEYDLLDSHYKQLKEIIDVNDVIQDSLARDLCEIKVQQVRARGQDTKAYKDLTTLYQQTLKEANIKVKSKADTPQSEEELCWGNFVREVERHSPADLYQDKGIYADADGIGEYFRRHVLRPMKNFFGMSSEMDPKYSISEGQDENTEPR